MYRRRKIQGHRSLTAKGTSSDATLLNNGTCQHCTFPWVRHTTLRHKPTGNGWMTEPPELKKTTTAHCWLPDRYIFPVTHKLTLIHLSIQVIADQHEFIYLYFNNRLNVTQAYQIKNTSHHAGYWVTLTHHANNPQGNGSLSLILQP